MLEPREAPESNPLEQALAAAGGRPLLGAACYTYNPVFLEMAAALGFDAVWIEMEHGATSFSEAAQLCRLAKGFGLLSFLRIADAGRENVLKGAECGPDMLDVPMADSVEIVRDLVRYARFAPEGERGHFGVSRALRYGIGGNLHEAQQRVNKAMTLFAQIETVTALERIDELAAVPGTEIFIGPADLAASMGLPWQTGHSKVLAAAETIVATARRHGKKVAVACGPAEFGAWAGMGVDLMFCANDVACMRVGAEGALRAAREAVESRTG